MNIIKQKVKAKSHSLPEKWEKWSFDIETVAEVAKIMQEEIDWEILSNRLVEYGWTKVGISAAGMHTVEKWVEENIQGKYKFRGTTWLFESEKDAAFFILRWS